MDSIYCTGTDVEMNRMFDQYLFKGPESFDLSLTIPDPVQDNANNYMSADQTFHTPSFGDEEFEIPPISLPPSSMANENNEEREMNNQSYNTVMTHSGMGEPVSVMTLGGTTMSSQSMIANAGLVGSPPTQMLGQPAHYSPHGIYLQSMGEGTAMLTSQANQHGSQSFDTRPTYTLSAHHPNHPTQSQLLLQPQTASPSAMMGSTLLTTINQSQLGSQLGLQFMPQRAPSVNGSPPGSNQTSPSQETSEDSDDSAPVSQVGGAGGTTPLLQLMGGMKRPSPEPADNKNIGTKKPKVPKKKKKRDPNEPQKPVSAYALFFRDTQAAIKGQNPNASFGEVSKIVASMWDSLDAEHKNVYKKKTEAAKKEYLKALAAYRASLVSKQSTSEHVDNMYSSGASYGSNGSYNQQGTAISSSTVMMASSISQAMPQIQQHPQLQPPQGTITTLRPPSQASSMGQPLQQQNTGPNYPQQQPNYAPQQQSNISVSGGQQSIASPQGVTSSQPPVTPRPTTCLRNGCQNPAVESPDWDSEYCSNEDVFTAWVASRQTSNSFASVK